MPAPTIKIMQDEDPMNPRTEFDNLSKMVFFHRKYDLGDKDHGYTSGSSIEELKRNIRRQENVAVMKTVYMYDHSGLAFRTTPFSCPWDSGVIGVAYITVEDMQANKMSEEDAAKAIESELETYAQYISGDVWGYEILDEKEEVVDSCFGFYGKEYCEKEASEALKTFLQNQAWLQV